MRSAVVLPAPFGPRSPKHRPAGTSRSSRSTATRGPKRFTTPRHSTTARGASGALLIAIGGCGGPRSGDGRARRRRRASMHEDDLAIVEAHVDLARAHQALHDAEPELGMRD